MPLSNLEAEVLRRIDPERLRDFTLELVRIPSPTGHERALAEHYAACLRAIGLEVSLNYEIPESPTVVAWLRGKGNGRTLQIHGHTDTVDLPHEPACCRDGILYGRGAADMKCALAAMAEVARTILEAGVELQGNLLLTAAGTHEWPGAHKEAVLSLARNGPLGDAIVIPEIGDKDGVPITQKGLIIFDILISRPGTTMHETAVPPDAVNPLWAGQRMMELLRQRSVELAAALPRSPHLGSDTLFVGLVQSGDFFNTLPTTCRIMGTRRWAPGLSSGDVEAEFTRFAEIVERETGTSVKIELERVGEAAALSEDEPIVLAIQEAYRDVVGKPWPVTGTIVAADAWIFNTLAKIPTTYHGADLSRAHSNPEYVALSDVVRSAKVYALTALRFAGCRWVATS